MGKALKVAALLGLISAAPMAQAAAPFGLAWGASEAELAAAGINLTRSSTFEGVTAYGAARLPENDLKGKAYALFIDAKHGLQHVTLVSGTIDEDASGRLGKRHYEIMKLQLSRKYGQPLADAEYAGEGFGLLPSEFYPCLTLTQCGSWSAVFGGMEPGELITLRLNGIDQGIGYTSISYEGPKWREVSKR